MIHKKELLRGLWVAASASKSLGPNQPESPHVAVFLPVAAKTPANGAGPARKAKS